MKTSKIIFLSLLGTIALIILASAIFIKIQGQQPGLYSTTSKIARTYTTTKKDIPSFKVLSINNSTNITLVRSDSSFIEIYSLKDSLAPVVNYTTDKDTLKLKDFMPSSDNKKLVNINIHYSELLKNIKLKNSSITLESLNSGKMSIEMDSSSVMADGKSKESNLQVLDVLGKNKSNFQIRTGKFKIDSLNIVLRNSNAYLWSKGNRLRCDISDKSNIRVTEQPSEIVMKKDSTSQFSVRETQTVFR